jgi:methyl-accepting chemotaxis protein
MLHKTLTVRTKVTLLTMVASLLPVCILLAVISVQRVKLGREVGRELDQMVQTDLGNTTADVYALCQAENEAALHTVRGNLNVARMELQRAGGLGLSPETVAWNAVDPLSGQRLTATLPGMEAGEGTSLGRNDDPGRSTPLIDEVAALTGSTCCVFQRMNERGDMLLAATNALTKEGRRAVGTFVPALEQDGSPNPMVESILKGQDYSGRARIAGEWYVAACQPLRDPSGDVFGLICVGVKQQDLPGLRQAMLDKKVGQSGYVFVLAGSGTQRGQYIVSKDSALDGENAWEAKDADGKPFIQTMINEGVKQANGSVILQRYPWKDDGESQARARLAAVTYFAPWDWVIGVGAYEDDFRGAHRRVNQALVYLFMACVITGLLAMGLVLALSIPFLNISFTRPVRRLQAAAEHMARGDVGVTIEAGSQDELGKLAQGMRAVVDNIKEQAEVAQRIAAGDLSVEVHPRCDDDLLAKSMSTVVQSLRDLNQEMDSLTGAAVEGRLSVRGDTTRFQGGYGEIIQGANATLDALIGPLNTAAQYINRISHGDIPPKIEEDYRGDFEELKNSINTCIDAIGALVADVGVLSDAAVQGHLGTRVDASCHGGEFAKIVQGMNDTLDAVIAPLNTAALYVDCLSKGTLPPLIEDDYPGDYADLKNNLNTCIGAIEALVTDTSMLSQSAVEGMLTARADLERHQGEYRNIVQGVNDTLDAVIGPLNMTAACIDRISKGDIPPKITEHCRGDFNEIKNNLNTCIDSINLLVTDMHMLSLASCDGHLGTRVDASRHGGDFATIVQGINNTLDAVIGPLNTAALYVDCLSKGTLPPLIEDEYPGDFNEIRNNLNTCIESIEALVRDAHALSEATIEGRLRVRANADKHSGEYGSIMAGFNRTLDTLVGYIDAMPAPVMTVGRDFTVRYLNQTGADLVGQNAEQAEGSKCSSLFKTAHCNTNECACDRAMRSGKAETGESAARPAGQSMEISYSGIPIKADSGEVIGALEVLTDQTTIKQAARLSQKQAAFQEKEVGRLVVNLGNLAEGNLDLDLEVEQGDADIQTLRKNFLTINESLGQARDAIATLVQDTFVASQAAVGGILSSRVDPESHQGEYRRIVEGLNETMNALVEPLEQTIEYLGDLSVGRVRDEIIEEYQGDFDKLKIAFNRSFGAIKSMIADTRLLSQAAVDGRLDVRADAGKHEGDFNKIVQGVNDTLDALVRPIQEAALVLARVADRDLRARMEGEYRGDLNKMKESLNTAILNLDDGMQQVAAAVEQVAAAASQIGTGSQALAQGASEQASNLEEVSASLQEMTSMTKQNAGNAKEARGMAEGARTGAQKGLQSMNRLSEAMEKIKTSSDATAKIVKTIDEIAFQTNLLALNAAVEAARAGDAGKGFAVVAEEVRNLAMRSADAAKNTANMIEESVRNAENGVELNQEVLAKLQEINEQTVKVGEVMSEISTGSEQQSSGIDQITSAVDQMDQVTQQNAASSEESASAAEELSGQSEELRTMVAKFRLSDSESSAASFREQRRKNIDEEWKKVA